MERRLAAILAADVAGYSLLMKADEDGTYRAWRAARTEVVDPLIAAARGRIVKHTGDGFLAEFPTVLAAVECAVAIQQRMHETPDIGGDGQHLQFRIGINLGDIIVDDEDIHGDGVNIAARLESLAEAGGVCVSADVYRQVSNRPGFRFEDLGERTVKNMPEPIRVYRVATGGQAHATPDPPAGAGASGGTRGAFDAILDDVVRPALRPALRLVGREREQATLAEAFGEARDRQGNIVLIRGEPGIGKSSLASTFARHAQESGAVAVFGQCHETLGSPPYWPWLQILKALQSDADGPRSVSSNVLESLAASVAPAASKSHSTFASDAGTEQFLLFNRIVGLLAEYASQRALVLVIDDLHWADRSSLLLLTHLCRKLGEYSILVIGTYREVEITRKHPLFETLGDVSRQAVLRRLALKGLSEQDVCGLITGAVSCVLPDNVLAALYEKTEGNPLFVSEVMRILQQDEPRLAGEQWALEIPEGIQEAIGRRLNQLSEESVEMLSLAAVIGREFGLDLLNRLVPETEHASILQSLEEAVARGIIEEAHHTRPSYRFCHVLIRDILFAELSLARKILLHRKVADALVQMRDAGEEHSLGEIARHYYQALQGGQGDHAIDYAIRAAEHAASVSAFNEASEYYQLALDVISVNETRYASRAASIHLRMTECLQNAGVSSERTALGYNRSMAEAKKHGQHEIFALAACRMVYAGRAFYAVRESLRTIDEALGYVGEDDLVLRANVLAHRAAALKFNGRRREAEQVAFEAVAVAAASGDRLVHCNALCMALLALRGRPEKLSERIQLGEQALALARDADSPSLRRDPLEWLILSYQEKGDQLRVRELIAELEASVERGEEFKSHYFAVGASACQALFEGRWERTEALVEEAVELGAGKLDGGAEGVYGAQMFLLNRELGRLPMVQGALQRLVGDGKTVWKPGLLATYTELGLLDEARRLFDELADDDFRRIAEDELYLTCLVYMSEACMELDLGEPAAALYQRLVPYSGQMVSHPTAVCYGPADLYLGMLASQMNKLDDAQRLLARASELCEQAAPNMWRAHVRYRQAQVLQRHHFSGGRAAFDTLLSEARELARDAGLANLLARIERLDHAQPVEVAANADGLTPRELEVLALIVQGKSNKLIARELNRSLATVATHVRAILGKTHTANRTEAAAYALERNLCGSGESK